MGGHITGIGGIFFKCRDRAATQTWYRQMLGIDSGSHGAEFEWRERDDPAVVGRTVWSPFAADTGYFSPGDAEFMINYRVRDLAALLAHLEARGVARVGEIEEYDYGRFAWVIDPDGRKIELWEPRGEDAVGVEPAP